MQVQRSWRWTLSNSGPSRSGERVLTSTNLWYQFPLHSHTRFHLGSPFPAAETLTNPPPPRRHKTLLASGQKRRRGARPPIRFHGKPRAPQAVQTTWQTRRPLRRRWGRKARQSRGRRRPPARGRRRSSQARPSRGQGLPYEHMMRITSTMERLESLIGLLSHWGKQPGITT